MSDITLETINAKLDTILGILHQLVAGQASIAADEITNPGPADLK